MRILLRPNGTLRFLSQVEGRDFEREINFKAGLWAALATIGGAAGLVKFFPPPFL